MADEKSTQLLPHEEDLIFNKPSLKEFIRLIKNGSIQGIWPSTYEEFQEWNSTIYKQYPRGKQIESIDTSMTVLFADNLDNQNSDTLDLDRTTQRFKALKDEVTEIQESIIDDNYFDTIGIDDDTEYDMEYPEFILNTQDGSTNGTEIISNSEEVINKYKNNLIILEDLINKLIKFNPTRIPTDPVISDNAETKYKLFFTNQTNEIKTKLQSVTPLEYNLNKLLSQYKIIQEDICFLENIPNVYSNIMHNLNIIKNNIYKYYNNVINNSINDDIEIIETKMNKYNLDELNSSLLTYFDSISDLSINNINKILNFEISELNLDDIDYENEKTDQELYNEYIQPYDFLIQYLFYFENNAEITLSNEAITLKNNYIQNIQNEIRRENEYKEKINIINNLYEDLNDRISNIVQLNFVYYIQNNLETLTDIKLLTDGSIKDYLLITTWLNRGLNIVSAEYNLLNHYNISDDTMDYIYPALKDTVFEKLNQIIGKPNEDKGDNRTYFKIDLDSIYERINNIYNKYNQILTNISTNTFVEIPIVNFIIEDGSFSNRNSVIQSINSLYQKIMEHYNVLDILGLGSEGIKQNLQSEKEYLINLITTAQVEIGYIGTEQEFNEKIKQYFTENVINNLILRITNNHEDAVFSNDKIYPIIDDTFLNITNKQDVINSLNTIKQIGESINRLSILTQKLNNIEEKINYYTPIYLTDSIKHFFCFDVKDNISFDNEVTIASDLNDQEKNILKDGTLGIKINSKYHYPKIYNLADNITDQTRNTQIPTIGGLKSIFGNDFNKIGNVTLGNDYTPLYLSDGTFKTATKIISGLYVEKLIDDNTPAGWKVIDSSLNLTSLHANKIFGAVYNDYAEYRTAKAHPGRCIIENGDGTLSLSTGRLQLGANIVSDTYGFVIGETNNANCPVAVCGRVLAYPLESKELFTPGAAVCSGPEGTISLMSRDEIREWPDAIVGFVSEVPTYDTWGSDNILVDGRIWIKIK